MTDEEAASDPHGLLCHQSLLSAEYARSSGLTVNETATAFIAAAMLELSYEHSWREAAEIAARIANELATPESRRRLASKMV